MLSHIKRFSFAASLAITAALLTTACGGNEIGSNATGNGTSIPGSVSNSPGHLQTPPSTTAAVLDTVTSSVPHDNPRIPSTTAAGHTPGRPPRDGDREPPPATEAKPTTLDKSEITKEVSGATTTEVRELVLEELQDELDRLVQLAAEWDSAAQTSLAVITYRGEAAGANSDIRHSSASAIKPLWVAAAMAQLGSAAVEPFITNALVHSDNLAAGQIIDLIGVDAVNEWTAEVVKLQNTRLLAWRFGDVDRRAPEIGPDEPAENYTTTADLAAFHARLRRGELLEGEDSDKLIGWLRTTAEGPTIDAIDGAITQRLPEEITGDVSHKAGWLPPGCCGSEVRQILDAGVVPLPSGGWFSIAAVSRRGDYYDLSLAWVALAACRVYAVLSGDDIDCTRSGDGVPNPGAWGT